MDHAARRSLLAARLLELGADAFLVSALPNVRYLTGFTGSNGQLLMSAEGARFLTDGRYTEQALQSSQTMANASSFTGQGHTAPVTFRPIG